MLLIRISCKRCHTPFYICRGCYRGQAYCCDFCRISNRRASLRNAQKRYRRTEKGKKAHREAESRRRQRHSPENRKNMDDQGTTKLISVPRKLETVQFSRLGEIASCNFCGRTGKVVSQFPRRGYGKSRFEPIIESNLHLFPKGERQ